MANEEEKLPPRAPTRKVIPSAEPASRVEPPQEKSDEGDLDDEADEGELEERGVLPPAYWADAVGRGETGEKLFEELSQNVRKRATLAGPKLLNQLVGTIVLELERSGKRYEFNLQGGGGRSGEGESRNSAEGGESSAPSNCLIRIGEEHLLRIASGDLNPQVAMLTEKIHVQGKHGLAMYFFNLVAPRVRSI